MNSRRDFRRSLQNHSPKVFSIEFKTIQTFARRLEIGVVVFALAALAYRASIYWLLPPRPGEAYGSGDVIDFVFGLVLFLLSGLCALAAVMMSINSEGSTQVLAFRPAVVGITSFVVYFFLHPYVPRLI
jgi:hypothetical protein